MKKIFKIICIALFFVTSANAQTLTELQQQNARATGYAIVAARNPGISFTVYVIKWDGINDLEYNAKNQINYAWRPQAVVKGNFFDQPFDNNNFSAYSSVIVSQSEFDTYKSTGTDWWIVCSLLPSFSNSGPTVLKNGDVGIGTTNPDEKLTVKGKIHTQEVRVDMIGSLVPDYVFAPDYKLRSLKELENYVKQNNHLPEIPSAKEIEKNGLMLAEMNMSMLKKMEEMTLYVIELDRELNLLKEEVIELKKDNKELKLIKNRLLKIETIK